MALILRNGGSQNPDMWLKEPRNNHPDVSGDSWDYGSTIVSANPQFPDNEPNVEGSVSFTATWNRFTYRNYPFFSFEEAHRAVVG